MATTTARSICRRRSSAASSTDGERLVDTTVGRVLLCDDRARGHAVQARQPGHGQEAARGPDRRLLPPGGQKKTVLLADKLRTLGYTLRDHGRHLDLHRRHGDPGRQEARARSTAHEGSVARSRSSTPRASSPTASATTRSSTSGPRSPSTIAKEMMDEIGSEMVTDEDTGEETQEPSLQPDLHDGRLGRPRLARSRSGSWPACAASWPSRRARSSRPRSPRTSARV